MNFLTQNVLILKYCTGFGDCNFRWVYNTLELILFFINYHYLSVWLELFNDLLKIIPITQMQLLKMISLFMIQCGQFKIQQ